MKDFFIIVFAVSSLYAVFGNVAVYLILSRRRVPMRSLWAGTPGYLYRVCKEATPVVGTSLQRFAFSTNIAFLVAMILGVGLAGFQRQ